MTTNKISTIIIFHGRHKHLLNTLQGLASGKNRPDEVILVEIDKKQLKLPESNLDIKHYLIEEFEPSNLPIAAARNLGALKANYDILAFLDVDCIPSKTYISDIKESSILVNELYMGCPMYLSEPVDDASSFNFMKSGLYHPHRPKYEGTQQWPDYGMFWSLCFYITAQLFFEIGGFDESYLGYGAEDTDFSFKCRALEIPLMLTSFKVYHQQHSFMRPPLKSLKSIVNNSNTFHLKWSKWPMDNHLTLFRDMGFIKWSEENSKPIAIIQEPSIQECIDVIVSDEPFA